MAVDEGSLFFSLRKYLLLRLIGHLKILGWWYFIFFSVLSIVTSLLFFRCPLQVNSSILCTVFHDKAILFVFICVPSWIEKYQLATWFEGSLLALSLTGLEREKLSLLGLFPTYFGFWLFSEHPRCPLRHLVIPCSTQRFYCGLISSSCSFWFFAQLPCSTSIFSSITITTVPQLMPSAPYPFLPARHVCPLCVALFLFHPSTGKQKS